MRLKAHRGDVKFIQEASYFVDNEDKKPLREAARRYLNLIKMVEADWNMTASFFEHKDKVLKDS